MWMFIIIFTIAAIYSPTFPEVNGTSFLILASDLCLHLNLYQYDLM